MCTSLGQPCLVFCLCCERQAAGGGGDAGLWQGRFGPEVAACHMGYPPVA